MDYISNIKPEQQIEVRKVLDSAFLCIKTRKPLYTDFFDPKSISILTMALNKLSDIKITLYGGADNCERVMLCIAPIEHAIKCKNFPIRPIYVNSSKFSTKLTHRDFLGSIIGLGISRGKIGDIFCEDGNATVFVHTNIADFIVENLTKVGNVKVSVSHCENVVIRSANGKKIKCTVASIRADAVVGEAFSISRAKAKDLINSEKLFVNWTLVTNGAAILKNGDVLSLRGSGRATIVNIGGITKKNRIFLELERWL